MSAATTFRLELPDGTVAEPPTFATIELNSRPGDTVTPAWAGTCSRISEAGWP